MLTGLRDEVVRRAMGLMQDPRVMKLASDPRVMKLAMQAFAAPARAKAAWEKRTKRLAKTLGFATRAEMRELERAIDTLRSALESMKASAASAKSSPKK